MTAALFGTGAFATWPVAVAPRSTFPIWPTLLFAGVAALALYMCFATIWCWWPTERSADINTESAAADTEPGTATAETQAGSITADDSANPVSASVPVDPRALRDLPVEDGRTQSAAVESEPGPAPKPTPTVTDRWYHTSDGGKVPALMHLTHTSMSHHGYRGRQPEETPPSVKIGMLVACQPIDPAASGTGLRAKFLAFLNSPTVRTLVTALTEVQPGMSWKNLAGHGPRTLEAALTASEDPLEGVPAASALFLPPTAGESLYLRDGRAATLLLYLEPRTADSQVPPASDLATWSRRFSLALAVPGAFADFLNSDVGLATSNHPRAQLGVWLESYQPLTVMVDIDGLQMLPGSSPSNQFIGWAFADPDGKPAAGVARDLIVQLCEYTLHLDDFERVLVQESS